MTRRGFTLIEVILGCALLLMVTMVMFSVFRFGYQGFRLACGRNDLQSEARATLSRLQQDMEQSTFKGITFDAGVNRQVSVPLLSGASLQPRHLLSMPSLSDWNSSSQFDSDTGMPIWDGYVLYQPTLGTDKARLFRVELSSSNLSGQSWPDLMSYSGLYLSQPAPPGTTMGGATVLSLRALAGNLLGFKVTKSSKDFEVVLRLWNRTKGPTEGRQQRDEILELQARILPKNQAY